MDEVIDAEITSVEYIADFLIGLFYLFFLPVLIGIIFMIMIADWFQIWIKQMIPDPWVRYLTSVVFFIAMTFIIVRTYIVEVLENPNFKPDTNI